jgi:hypothetical protein
MLSQAESDFMLAEEGTSLEGLIHSINIASTQHRYLSMPRADVIIRSSDCVNFRVHNSMLVASSTIFAEVFSRPLLTSQELVDGLPVMSLS